MNKATIYGTVKAYEPINDQLYKGRVEVRRTSGVSDTIPFITLNSSIKIGESYKMSGEVHTKNTRDAQGKLHKSMYVFAYIVESVEAGHDINEIEMQGYLVSKDILRSTPLGRTLIDFVIAVNKGMKSHYLSCITWGGNACQIDEAPIGSEVICSGRFQSRGYTKKTVVDGVEISQSKTAYEISLREIDIVHHWEQENER